MRIIYGLIAIAIGYLLIRYSIQITETMGRIEWAEEHLKSGLAGTYSLYRLLGLAIIILALLYMFGILGFLISPIAPLFGGAKGY